MSVDRPSNSRATRGVYFLGNDRVLEWAKAFLSSFRAFNPTQNLVLIPFDTRADQLVTLALQHGATIYESETFGRLEEIGRRFEKGVTSFGPHWFRRFAAFWGPLENFLYLDSRTLVLADVTPLIDQCRRCDCDLAYYDRVPQQVYKPGEFRLRMLSESGLPEFASCIWASRRGLFDIDALERLAEELLPHRDALNNRNTDQFFLNYICTSARLRAVAFPDADAELVERSWARDLTLFFDGRSYRNWDHGGVNHLRRVVVVNWAGIRLAPGMPNDSLHFEFRNLGKPAVLRRLAAAGRWLVGLPNRVLDACRRNRWVNTLYHRIRVAC